MHHHAGLGIALGMAIAADMGARITAPESPAPTRRMFMSELVLFRLVE
jgi:hypothetical protein